MGGMYLARMAVHVGVVLMACGRGLAPAPRLWFCLIRRSGRARGSPPGTRPGIESALTDVQAQLLLSRYCVISRVGYLLRVMLPSSLDDSMLAFDDFAARAFVSYTHVVGFDGHARAMLRLPLREGGAGWTSMSEISAFAYVASVTAAVDGFCDVSPGWRQVALDLYTSVAQVVSDDARFPALGRVARSWVCAHESVLLDLGDRTVDAGYDQELTGNLGSSRFMQRRLTRAFQAGQRARLTARLELEFEIGLQRRRLATRALRTARRARERLAGEDAAGLLASVRAAAGSPSQAAGVLGGWRGGLLASVRAADGSPPRAQVAAAELDAAVAALHAAEAERREAGAAVRLFCRRLFAWSAARSWGATDYLAVLPDSVDYRGWTSLSPPAMRVTVALHLGLQYAPVVRGEVQLCGCAQRCGVLDGLLDRTLSCARLGHSYTHSQRHDCWSRSWGAFLAAHRMPLATEPRRALQGTDCTCYDHLTRSAAGRLLGLDVAVHHPTRPGEMSFSTPQRRLEGWEARKRRVYAASLWAQQPEVPDCIPLIGTTLGQVGPAAQRFFAAVVRQHVAGASLVAELGFQHLHGAQHTVFWRRRICVQLRIAVATQVMARVHAAGGAMVVDAARRAGRTARDFEYSRGQQVRVLAVVCGAPPSEGYEGPGGVGSGFGGDRVRRGVLGDGFARSGSLGAAMG